jgi:hypothetical protein
MDPTEYEQFVREGLLHRLNAEGVTIHHRRRIPGQRSGYEHEIDLSFETELAGTLILTIVECKAYSRPVSVDDLLEFASRVDDISAHKGMFISTSGFTQGAIKLAESKNIALIQAHRGQWQYIARYMAPPPRPSRIFFHLDHATVVEQEGQCLLKLSPIDENDLIGVQPVDAEWVQKHLGSERYSVHDVFFQIISPGGSEMEPGCIHLGHV